MTSLLEKKWQNVFSTSRIKNIVLKRCIYFSYIILSHVSLLTLTIKLIIIEAQWVFLIRVALSSFIFFLLKTLNKVSNATLYNIFMEQNLN